MLGLITALILLGAALLFWPRPQPAAVQLQAPPTPAADPAVTTAAAPAAASPTPSPLVVFVSGAVTQPGLYTLAAGARVGDALAAAGGLLPEVDMALINQAQPLVDGAQLHIPAPTATALPATAAQSPAGESESLAAIPVGTEADPAPMTAAGEGPQAPHTAAPVTVQEPAAGLSVPPALPTPTLANADTGGTRAAALDLPAAGALINVNTATSAELESLPAIGPAKAQAIIANRPYAAVDELDRVPGIGPATLEQIRPYVTIE